MVLKGHIIRKPVDILTKEQVGRIHWGVLDVLEKTGVTFNHEKALTVLRDAGCYVNYDKKRVRFPSYLVEECLRKCPSSVTVKARNPKYDLRIGDPYLYFIPWCGMDMAEIGTWERKTPTIQDYVDAAKVLDYLDEAHSLAWGPYVNLQGIPFLLVLPLALALRTKNSEKAMFSAGGFGTEIWRIKISKVVDETTPMTISCSPPLTWAEDQLNVVFHAAEADFPIVPASGLAAGGNAPSTLAGGLVQNCAEIMSLITFAQIIKPGIEVLAGNYSQPMDMRTGTVIQGGVERGLIDAAWSQIWRERRIPRGGIISSDSKVPDYQCATEKVMSVTLMALAGTNCVSFIGGVYDELMHSPIVAILDNDVAHMVARILEGINVTDETLAIDLIEEVGPIPGHYLNKEHTRVWWKKEQLIPDLADRLSYPEWVKKGRRDIIARAREKYREILATHEPTPLPKDLEREIDGILEEQKKTMEKALL